MSCVSTVGMGISPEMSCTNRSAGCLAKQQACQQFDSERTLCNNDHAHGHACHLQAWITARLFNAVSAAALTVSCDEDCSLMRYCLVPSSVSKAWTEQTEDC